MSLYENMFESFIFMEKSHVADGEGGFITTWKDGEEFKGVAVLDTTMQARIAEHDGVTSTFTITTHKNIQLEFHDVVKKVADGSIYRVTSNGKEKSSPKVTSEIIDIAQVTAEKWVLPQ